MKKISIVGLGLIGGSLGLALKGAGIEGLELSGYSRRPEAAAKARARGAIDEQARSLAACVEGAGLVILATPVAAMESILQAIGPLVREGCIVTDVASTKAMVMRWASETLPQGVSFVGGHPMAGKEVAGIEGAEPGLFGGCTYCLCPSPSAAPEAVETLVSMVNLLRAKPYFVDPVEHDFYVAGISHLPMLVSTALVAATAGSSAWREMSRLAATGYRDATRLASSDPVMSGDIYTTNRESLERWLDLLMGELESLRENIATGGSELEARLRQIKEARDRWQRGEAVPAEATVEPPGGWGRFLFGSLLSGASPGRRKAR